MNDKKEYIRNVMLKAMAAGLCSKQFEFAQILGVSRSGLSAALNGDEKNLTDSLVRKVRSFAIEHGLEETPTAVPQSENGFWVPEAFRQTMENMSETIRIQAQLLAQYQGTGVVGLGLHAPKNFRADGK